VPADKYRKEDGYKTILLPKGVRRSFVIRSRVRISANSLGPLIAATTRINIGAPVYKCIPSKVAKVYNKKKVGEAHR
jgi:hypothetical protein